MRSSRPQRFVRARRRGEVQSWRRREAWCTSTLFVTILVYAQVAWFFYFWWLGGVDNYPLGTDTSQLKVWALEPIFGSLTLVDVSTWIHVACLALIGLAMIDRRRRPKGHSRTVALAMSALVIGGLQYANHLEGRAAARFDNDRLLLDDDLVAQFVARRSAYETHAARTLDTIDRLGPRTDWISVYVTDWRWFADASKKIRHDGGHLRAIQLRDGATRIDYIATRNGLGDRALAQGITYLPTVPSELRTALDPREAPPGEFEHIRRLDGSWYAFLRRGR